MTQHAGRAFTVAASLIVAACSSGSSDSATTTPVNVADNGATELAADEPADELGAHGGSSANQSGDSTPSTTLVASQTADLPTGSPDELATVQDVARPVGPLPIPTVGLVEVERFESPIEVTRREADDRNFVVEQGGRIFAFDDLSTELVLDITDLTDASGEQGLLGAAFHPAQDFAYVHYNDSAGNSVLAEFTIDPVTAVFDPSSRREVLTIEQPFPNHNGGEVAFGPDGFLYLGLGDGGAADDPLRTSLDLGRRLGKILRIDPRESGADPFTIPADNPFTVVDGADPTIWSYGLRNPWKFSFDSLTGDLWIADVGQRDIEEVDFAPAVNGQGAGRGLSFGWSAFEGNERFNDDESPDGHTPPVVTYSHGDGDCSISGGAVYRGAAVPDLDGWYVYGDFCSGRIWGYDPTSGTIDPTIIDLGQLSNLSAIAVGGEGELFAVSTNGTVARFTAG